MKIKITNTGPDSRSVKSDAGNGTIASGKSAEIEFEHSVHIEDEEAHGGLSLENTGDKELVATIGETDHVVAIGQTITLTGPYGAHIVAKPDPEPEVKE